MRARLNRIRQFGRKLRRAAIAELRAWASRGPVKPRVILYESFAGNGALCNPEAIFRGLLRDHEFDDLRHIWSLDSLRGHSEIRREFRRDKRVRFVRRGTAAYFHALSTSGFLVNNATFPPEFSKRDGQTYLNTWHGTPLKLMGYDMPNGAIESANTLKNFVAADWLLSQNPFMTDQMYEKAYRLRGAFRGRVLETGYPRVDRQFLDDERVSEARALLEGAGLDLGARTIVLWAPTWKGDSFSQPQDDALELADRVEHLQQLLGDDFAVLLKTHQSVHAFAHSRAGFARILVPNDLPTNLVLGATDILLTDYSSIFFDFLASKRPILFYTPDAKDYSSSRGTYFEAAQLPGPVYSTLTQVASAIKEQSDGATDLTAQPVYADWCDRFASLDDGNATERVIDAVFRQKPDPSRVVSLAEDSRHSVLLYLGGMRSNGITSSALNLLRGLDHDRIDVSVLISRPLGEQQRHNQSLIDPRVRQFHRIGGMNGNKAPHLRRRRAERLGVGEGHREQVDQSRLWDEEWRRCLGDARFDAVVDFSGYSPFWATLMLHSPGGIRSIWLHNDMAADADRVVRGRARMSRGLRAVFALYSQFDRLVSVSRSLRDVNREALATAYAIEPSQFTFARNLVDGERVLEGMRADLDHLDGHPLDEDGRSTIPAWVPELRSHTGRSWFVSVGRFSTEKNQARLIRAFAKVQASRPEVRLILVGYGPLREKLQTLIDELCLPETAFIVGPYPNPFAIVAAADCFVLSSDYEGQPMVLLEAAIVRMPIISVAFRSVGDALDAGELLVVAQNDAALAEGMMQFIDGRLSPAHLDVAAYSNEAANEFSQAVFPWEFLGTHPKESSHPDSSQPDAEEVNR